MTLIKHGMKVLWHLVTRRKTVINIISFHFHFSVWR